ncbi:DNA polymerase-3 subunit beta [Clostridium acetobutylicum]|uniref:Beta sliding clamp n=1 Tax=Clostridium acetobutylicum (strain ATCC 824 / DSM 792 / JCM 1419 / IAM 19013 / LMG 5710 / NBRC 13948 / NRRL B-527 / VKM B-1787 / 2291 / W) TaxID=272562 RepID=Q97N34_CLOAB|nr:MULTISPECIES: DNA polymerase III subunit beta [Clostridium]AAK77989.1 DNA polymerase III beta subunit [Clostridium acetobutylicum ATCC 824]ADZ19045.1 DNA polymerase III subunit beta [Clostridium acetobutylicum EA 2018]AEI34211.1 DNA polymerase III subunit beta [Clostridium acetobutylicum DSM 1731]AWV80665.1 DNA polymerase III subunit beta [Clostridium acetobutylicum]KHD34491.1 DNA polymerase III subunit beta [Clostridium acetobutylicum]
MKFICEKNILQEAIITAQKAVTGKSTMPVLQGILMSVQNNELTLIGSDIDLSIETKINVEVLEEGKVVLDARLLSEIIRKLPNSKVEIQTIENNCVEITCNKSKLTLVYLNPNDFPSLPEIDENSIFKINQKTLKTMIKGTIFAIAQDETRPILTGVLFEIKDSKLNLVAIDGYRLALRSQYIDNETSINAVIPGKTLNEVIKILEDDGDVNITFTSNHILFNLGNTKIISRLLEGEFIKYNSIIPEEYNLNIVARKEELLDCIERASLMAKDGNNNLIKLDIEDDVMIITSNSQLGNVREEINIILQGQPLKIAFNSKYLIDVLKIMNQEEIVMNFSSSISPCIIKNKENDDSTYLILPVRLATI